MRHSLEAAIVSILIVSATLFADAIVDDVFDNDQNDFQYYWYYFDDNSGVGKDDRLQSTASGTPSVINVNSLPDTVNLAGKKIMRYEFTTGIDEATTQRYATLPFKFGSTWKTSADTLAQPFVGIGTMLADNNKSIDLTGATAVTFKIRSHKGALNVNFKIQTLYIDHYSEVLEPPTDAFEYFSKNVAVTTDWTRATVLISDLKQPNGSSTSAVPKTFDIKNCTKLVWEIQKDANSAITKDTLDIEGVMILGYTRVPDGWRPVLNLTNLPTSGKFADFEGTYPAQSPFKPTTYWYTYNDRSVGGTSDIIQGAKLDSITKRVNIDWIEGSGSDNIGKGLFVTFKFGKSFAQSTTETQRFIEMGCNTYDTFNCKYWDAKDSGIKSIYFHYIADWDSSKATLEICDINDVSDAANPTKKSLRGPGVVWHRDLPSTGGMWRAVEIPFDSLVCDKNSDGLPNIALDQTKLSKIQWKIKGSEGQSGIFGIDNIYFPGTVNCFCTSGTVKRNLHSAQKASFNAQYHNGFVYIKLNSKTSFTTGKLSLFRAQGSVISAISLTKTNTATTDLPAKNLPSGVYFVKIEGVDVNGKTVVLQSQVNIFR